MSVLVSLCVCMCVCLLLAASFDGLQPVLAACHCNFFFYIGK